MESPGIYDDKVGAFKSRPGGMADVVNMFLTLCGRTPPSADNMWGIPSPLQYESNIIPPKPQSEAERIWDERNMSELFEEAKKHKDQNS